MGRAAPWPQSGSVQAGLGLGYPRPQPSPFLFAGRPSFLSPSSGHPLSGTHRAVFLSCPLSSLPRPSFLSLSCLFPGYVSA